MASSEEMIATVPTQELGPVDGRSLADVMDGLKEVEETGSTLPGGRRLQSEYELPESYERIASGMEYFQDAD
jgi:hypothetical protein